jgi:hypothetical protein
MVLAQIMLENSGFLTPKKNLESAIWASALKKKFAIPVLGRNV